jgi:hypothetical protein
MRPLFTSLAKRAMVLAATTGMLLAGAAAFAGGFPCPYGPHRDSVNANDTDVYTMLMLRYGYSTQTAAR